MSQRRANLAAVTRIFDWLKASIAAHQTIGVETVLSTGKYRELVREAHARGFEVRLIYVLLKSVELNIQRVKMRVRKGGHNVPRRKIIQRRQRSLEQLPWFLENADLAWVFDNSGAKPLEIGRKEGHTILLDPKALPEVEEAVRQHFRASQMSFGEES